MLNEIEDFFEQTVAWKDKQFTLPLIARIDASETPMADR